MIPPPPAAPTDLSEPSALSRRGSRGALDYARRVAEVLREVIPALAADALPRRGEAILRQEPGLSQGDGRRIALYVTYSPTGVVTEMVRRQLALYRSEGFQSVVISVSPTLSEADWHVARQDCALLVHRANHGRDFGAWRDLIGPALQRWPGAEELLLANDSVLGPLAPLGPVFAALRAGGEGLFGLVESQAGGAHLQSNFLLIRGARAIADAAAFLRAMRPSASKWLIVQRGELALSPWMRARGHRVAALFPYAAAVDAALAEPRQRAALRDLMRGEDGRDALLRRPLNPQHHLWRVLPRLGYPFLKTELIRNNPWDLPGIEDWRALVPPNSPCSLPVLEAHLAAMGGGTPGALGKDFPPRHE